MTDLTQRSSSQLQNIDKKTRTFDNLQSINDTFSFPCVHSSILVPFNEHDDDSNGKVCLQQARALLCVLSDNVSIEGGGAGWSVEQG